MAKIQYNTKYFKPHDAYFKAVFSIVEAARGLFRYALPPEISEQLDWQQLALSAHSYVDEGLRETFSDLVYECFTHADEEIRICLLFEHKSYPPGRGIYPQLSRYLAGIQEKNINIDEREFTLTIPIVFYHGTREWEPLPIASFYNPAATAFQRYVPTFEFAVVNLQALTDQEIRAIEDDLLVRNIFLAFKHAWDNNFFRENYREVFIFADKGIREEAMLWLFYYTFIYVHQVSSIKKEELMGLIESLPPEYDYMVKSAWDEVIEHYGGIGLRQGMEKGLAQGVAAGMEKGMEKGMDIGLDEAIKKVIIKRPTLSDEEIADLFDVTIERVARIRASLR